VAYKHLKLVVGGLLIVAALGYVTAAVARAGWMYYLPVDDYAAQPAMRGKRVRIAGTVSGLRGSEGVLEFELAGRSARIEVVYRGTAPVGLHEGGDAVAEGTANADGVFAADVVLTKCASKYESRKGATP
jgi:cytochrome c-type biogenesis protein CcmE